jgi:hypothetical protein
MRSSATVAPPCGRRSPAASVVLAAAAVLAGSACYEFSEVEPRHPVEPRPLLPHVELSTIEPEDCARVGEVSGFGSATDNPTRAAENARNNMRRNAAAMGANYVLLDMDAAGVSDVEGSATGRATPFSLEHDYESESRVTATDEYGLWGTAFYCPWVAATPQPSENAPCGVHEDCPAGQFCAPSGRCRRP